MALRDKLSSLANTAAGRANNAIENGKLGLKISSEEKKITEYALQIGELMVDKMDNGEIFDDELSALYASIKASREIIEAARSEIEANRQENEAARQARASDKEKVCACCGAPLMPDDNYCSKCGTKADAPAEEPEVCAAGEGPEEKPEACAAPEAPAPEE